MKKRDLPLFKKLLICIKIILIILSNICFVLPQNTNINNYSLPFVAIENKIESPLLDYKDYLENNGYTIDKIDFKNKYCYNNKTLNIEDLLDISIVGQKIILDNEEFYFLNEKDCNDFINKIQNIKKEQIDIQTEVIKKEQITCQSVLEEKIEKIKIQQKNKIEEEQKRIRVAAITSRSSNINRNFNKIPIATYTYISSYFGERSSRRSSYHTGVDFAAPYSTEIYSLKDGIVTFAGWNGSYGNFISIQHNDNTISRYAHCSKINVSVNQNVSMGDVIGYVGSTGNSTGPHLHLEILINNNFVNPLDYLK